MTGTTDAANQLCHKSTPGAAEECGSPPRQMLQINLIAPAQTASTPGRISYSTLSTSVSDEWPVLYADWRRGSKADFSTYTISSFAAIRSNSFDVTNGLDRVRPSINRHWVTCSQSVVCFRIRIFSRNGATRSINPGMRPFSWGWQVRGIQESTADPPTRLPISAQRNRISVVTVKAHKISTQ